MQTAEDTVSIASSHTHVGGKSCTRGLDIFSLPSQEQLAVDKMEKTEDWEYSPNNPRNWSASRKWTATALVSILPLGPLILPVQFL